MPLITLIAVQCSGEECGNYLAPDQWSRPTVGLPDMAASFTSQQNAVTAALERGWSAYPLLCPPCKAAHRRRLRHGRKTG